MIRRLGWLAACIALGIASLGVASFGAASLGFAQDGNEPAEKDEEFDACRSVHLAYAPSDVSVFVQTVRVDETVDHTYFMTCGWNTGYFGLQQLNDGRKTILFSVWDPTQGDDPKKVDQKLRVKTLFKADDVRVGRFGGEGTGGQSFFDYDWKPGTTYTLAVECQRLEDRTAYTGWFFVPEKNEWKKLVTFATVTDAKSLSGLYSFLEDFRRNGDSYHQRRRATFGPGWVLKGEEWTPITRATFTADGSKPTNIDAGVDGDNAFYLATGGKTPDHASKLRKPIDCQTPASRPKAIEAWATRQQ